MPDVFRSWTQGTVIRSWLLDLLVRALDEDPDLKKIRGWAEDSGEGRWTLQAAIEHAVPMPVIAAALFARFASRQQDSPGDEGGRRAAQPVRRARDAGPRHEPTPGITPEPTARRRPRPAPEPRCTSGTSRSPTSGPGPRPRSPFEPGPSVLVGPNGQGKTNLVEALGYVATLGSHRVATDAPLVREGAAARRRAGRGGQRRP